VQPYLGKCLSFDLDFQSSVTFEQGSFGDEHTLKESVQARASAKLSLPADGKYETVHPQLVVQNGGLINGAPQTLKSSDYSVDYLHCTTVQATFPEDGQLTVSYLRFAPAGSAPDEALRVGDFAVSLVVLPNLSNYDFTRRNYDPGQDPECSNPSPEQRTESWGSIAADALLGQAYDEKLGTSFRDWTVTPGTASLATKEIKLNEGSSRDSGLTTVTAKLELIHTPAAE
jgi:hypothetical protein